MDLLQYILLPAYLICLATVLYYLFFAVAGHFYRNKTNSAGDVRKRIAVLITTHSPDASVVHCARQALFQDYPGNKYDVYVIGSSLRPEILVQLRQLPIGVVEQEESTTDNAKALSVALQKITKPYDIAVILHEGDIMKKDFLQKVNSAFIAGCYAMQGQCLPFNAESRNTKAEIVLKEINNHLLGKGHAAAGFSCRLNGSGIALSFRYLKQIIYELDCGIGFHRALELSLIRDNHQIAYLGNAIVQSSSDEYTRADGTRGDVKTGKRFGDYFNHLASGIYNMMIGRIDHANKVIQYVMIPPMAFTIMLVILMPWSLMPGKVGPHFLSWTILLGAQLTACALAIPKTRWNRELLQSITGLPYYMTSHLHRMLRTRTGEKSLMQTGEHSKV